MSLVVGSKVKYTPTDEVGTVVKVFATTVLVDWGCAGETRVNTLSVTPYGKQPKAEEPEVATQDFADVERRFGTVIEKRMRDLGLTFAQLAEQSGIPERTIKRTIQRDGDDGGGAVTTIERLAVALQVPPGEFWAVS